MKHHPSPQFHFHLSSPWLHAYVLCVVENLDAWGQGQAQSMTISQKTEIEPEVLSSVIYNKHHHLSRLSLRSETYFKGGTSSTSHYLSIICTWFAGS